MLGVLVVFLFFDLAQQRATGSGGFNWVAPAVYLGAALLLLVRGVVTVATTSYHLRGGELRVDSGLLQKQRKRVRLDRVQSVDVLQPLHARVFGLAEVRVHTAGTERSSVRLRYLAAPEGRRVRADLLARAAGLRVPPGSGVDAASAVAPAVRRDGEREDGETEREADRRVTGGGGDGTGGPTELVERPIVVVPPGQLVASVLLEMVSWRLVPVLVGPALVVTGQRHGRHGATGVGVVVVLWALLLIGHAVWTRVSRLWGFTVGDAADGIRIRHGLLSTSGQTVPPGRVQALLVHQPVAWRPFGWAQIRMNVAGYAGNANARATVLLPVTTLSYAMALSGWVLGGVDLEAVPQTRPPRRAAWCAPLWWRGQRAGADESVLVARHGLLSRTVDVVPHERTQSVRLVAGPWQRALGLATLRLDSTRGPVRTRVPHRDAAEARSLLDREVDRARSARRRWDPEAVPTAG
jgi:putative membrane protein